MVGAKWIEKVVHYNIYPQKNFEYQEQIYPKELFGNFVKSKIISIRTYIHIKTLKESKHYIYIFSLFILFFINIFLAV